MRIEFIEHGGVGYQQMTPQELTAAGVPQPIIDAKLDAVLTAQGEAEIDRLGDLLSVSSSRAARYEKKLSEAIAYVAAGRPGSVSEADYPILVPEAAARGMTKSELADLIIARAAGYNAVMGQAEAIRVTLPGAIAGAGTLAEKQAAIEALIAPFRAGIEAAVSG